MNNSAVRKITGNVFAVFSSAIVFFPLFIMVINSIKSRKEIFENPLSFPTVFSLNNYLEAFLKMKYPQAFINSIIITVCSTVIIIVFSSMAAWVLVRSKTVIANLIFLFIVSTMLIPFQSIMLPLLQYMSSWNAGMLDSRYGLIFMNVGFGVRLSIFLYHGFIKNVPVSLEEAGCIEGCSTGQIFFRIILPVLNPVTATVAILNVMALWNDFLLPSLVLSNKSLRTIPLSAFYFFGEYTIHWNLAMAGLILTIIPVIVFYLLAQKHIIKGVMSGSVK